MYTGSFNYNYFLIINGLLVQKNQVIGMLGAEIDDSHDKLYELI